VPPGEQRVAGSNAELVSVPNHFGHVLPAALPRAVTPRGKSREDMRYRHERMIRAREQYKRQRLQQEVEAALRTSLTDDEAGRWRALSEAVKLAD
jgi:hypothetical protein